ncbi:sigma-54 interaction domain-containing protein [Tepidibacter aestuarii]|uniref:sigma-54 interaction domain-containing protein n=1 Tax=Tepidibacter aestuarii TaxID=2925782 RepID=UPI0020C09B71|nr:sigma 54-interacting transcriptional regulator [Tepidibacter aestuarii]CAH2211951.1 Transcriptional regulatory protein TyrR (modular protein) [Tepidibacter aestuarii]
MDNKKNELENKLDYEVLKKILDNAFDEIFVYDNNYRVIYVNRACERHYGMKPCEIIGKTFYELLELKCWYPSVLPIIYKEKRRMTIEQKSYLGETIITTAVPILDENGDVELVVMSVRDKIHEIDVVRKKLEEGLLNCEKIDNFEDNIIEFIEEKIISRSQEMKKIIELSEKVSKVDSTILIRGESGTGKGVLVKHIHKKSNRKDMNLLTINCAAIPEDLLESELFGYVKGAFTGASDKGKVGLIELANKGTVFLDEIGELSLRLQAKLLHVIQDKQFIPIGGREAKKVDIRIIAATNRDLMEMVENKRFREDLYWRLNVIEIEIPSLRQRPKDIIALSNYFLNKFNDRYKYTCSLSEKCLEFFVTYSWPGNVRQLENIIERLVVTSSKPIIRVSDLPKIFFEEPKSEKDNAFPESFDLEKEKFEKELITKVHEKFKSSRKVAEALDISQSKATRLIRKYCP